MEIEIRESDLQIEFYRGSGPGGQHRNVTDSAVRIRHLPTGIVVQASENRSQLRNRELAMERLREALVRRAQRRKKRLATKVPRGEKEKRIASKKRQTEKRQHRKIPDD